MYQQQQSSEPAEVNKNLTSSLPSKTPVSLLQELCMRRGISPKYDLLQIEGAVHEPTFVYRVTVAEFTANGSGQSKKKAKHAAAKAVLDIIIHGSGPSGPSSAPVNGDATASPSSVMNSSSSPSDLPSTMVVSPYDDGIPGNPVGQLQELCMTRRWPPPTYELTGEEGFPHERTFTIACTIATYKEVGSGKSKKLAKRQAAYSMLQKLSDLPQEQQPNPGLNEDEEEVLSSKVSNLSLDHEASYSSYAHRGRSSQECIVGASLEEKDDSLYLGDELLSVKRKSRSKKIADDPSTGDQCAAQESLYSSDSFNDDKSTDVRDHDETGYSSYPLYPSAQDDLHCVGPNNDTLHCESLYQDIYNNDECNNIEYGGGSELIGGNEYCGSNELGGSNEYGEELARNDCSDFYPNYESGAHINSQNRTISSSKKKSTLSLLKKKFSFDQ